MHNIDYTVNLKIIKLQGENVMAHMWDQSNWQETGTSYEERAEVGNTIGTDKNDTFTSMSQRTAIRNARAS